MWYDGSVQKWARAVRRSRREPLASLRPGAFCCPDYQEGGTCMAKKEHEKHTISPRSARLQRRVQAAVSACYMMLLTAQPAAAADTMWTRFFHDHFGRLRPAGGHLHYRGRDSRGCGAAGAHDLPQRAGGCRGHQLAQTDRGDVDRPQHAGIRGGIPAAADPGRTVHPLSNRK